VAIIVVGGGGRGVGKTALVCGLIYALREFRWIAVKITSHEHGKTEPILEETEAGHGTDTARYLAAGAERAFLVTAGEDDLERRLTELWQLIGTGANAIFESNRIVDYVRADVCLAVPGSGEIDAKASFLPFIRIADALAVPEECGRVEICEIPPFPQKEAERMGHGTFLRRMAGRPVFRLAGLAQVSPEMLAWVRLRLVSARRF
jgi:hypothetical protein